MNSQTPDNEVAYSPLRINLILHCYSRADWIENEEAPAVQEELKSLVSSGILEPNHMPPHYKLTPKGLEFVKTLLATPLSPEEPVTEKDIKVSDKEPAPAWRELGPDEVIQEGDEIKFQKKWVNVPSYMVGVMVGDIEFRCRTHRPLCPNNAQKQEEMPLEGEIASIEWSCAHTARAIRYLRDEIQKLKDK